MPQLDLLNFGEHVAIYFSTFCVNYLLVGLFGVFLLAHAVGATQAIAQLVSTLCYLAFFALFNLVPLYLSAAKLARSVASAALK
jgi:uncharacterized membrane protein YuzA (DUF378 family)